MKFPRKQIPIVFALLGMAFFASATALAKPAIRNAAELPAYMANFAKLGDEGYLACIKSKVKAPAAANILVNFESTLSCQRPAKS